MPLPQLPPGRTVEVRAVDGVRLHAEVFGPADGYPIVLAHGITCAIGVWAHQIVDLAADYRVIAYDHRGHGRSDTPRGRHRYSLNHLAADLDATLNPGERAVIAGHSMGGIAITSWAQRYPARVASRADAVALINTTTGDLVRDVNLLRVPASLASTRIRAASGVIRTFGGAWMPRVTERPNKRFVARLAVGHDADPWVSDYVYRLFAETPPAGRGGWARTLVNSMGPQHISLQNLSVPTLVIGSAKDRLLPIDAARRIAADAPNLSAFVEMPGGHCAILECPSQVNAQLRALAESVAASQSVSR